MRRVCLQFEKVCSLGLCSYVQVSFTGLFSCVLVYMCMCLSLFVCIGLFGTVS